MGQKRGKWFTRGFILLLILFIATSALVGCDVTGGISGQLDQTTKQTVAVLDEAINSLNDQSASWQSVLQKAQAQLTEDAQSTVRNEISNSLQRAEQAAGSQIRCIIDFLRVRVQEDLKRIKAKLLHLPVDASVPTVCGVTPSAIDMSLDPTRRNLITLDGYNFDTTPPIQVFLVNSNQAGEVDVSAYLDRQTHYNMTLNLGDNGVPITSTSQRLILRWQNQQISSIPVIRSTPRCQKSTVTYTPASITFIPKRTRGDGDFHGYGPHIYVQVYPVLTEQRIKVNVSMTAIATGGPKPLTVASSLGSYLLWDAPPGQKIVFVSNTANTRFEYTDTNVAPDIFAVGVGYVSQLRFVGDTAGAEAGTKTMVTIVFKQLTIELKQTASCSDTP